MKTEEEKKQAKKESMDIDHIIPLSSGKTEEEILGLSKFINLQPLCSKINRDIKKGKKI